MTAGQPPDGTQFLSSTVLARGESARWHEDSHWRKTLMLSAESSVLTGHIYNYRGGREARTAVAHSIGESELSPANEAMRGIAKEK